MDASAAMEMAQSAIAMAILASAALHDWRSREVPDLHWAVLGAMGALLIIPRAFLEGGLDWGHACFALGSAMIVADILWDRESTPILFYPAMAAVFAAPLLAGGPATGLYSIPACYLVFMGMYVTGLIRGGADAKCLIVLAIAFPAYPGIALLHLPPAMGAVFVPAVAVLFAALLLTLPAGLAYAVRNARAGFFGRRMFSGYRMPIGKAEGAKAWPAEDVIGGEIRCAKPSDDGVSERYARLREAGAETVFVVPMIPFIIPLAIATPLAILAGLPLALVF